MCGKRYGFRAGIKLLILLVGTAVGAAVLADDCLFGAEFSAYAPGEALSNKGAINGTWAPLGSGVAATNAPGAGVNAMRLTSVTARPVATFQAAQSVEAPIRTIDLRVSTEATAAFGKGRIDAVVAFTFVDGAEGGVDAAAVVEGTWVRLGAEGLSFALDAWYDVRIAVHDIGEGRYVGFFIRRPAGDVQLTGSDGAKWFPVDKSHLGAVREVSLVGRCGFGDWSVARGADTADALTQTWIGGTNGDWNVATNWSAGRVPEAGEVVGILQGATLSRAGEWAEVSNAVLRVTAEGGLALEAGTVLTPVELDVSRPRVGKALAVQATAFGGIVPSLDVVWTRSASPQGGTRREVANTGTYTPTEADYERWLTCTVCAGGRTVLEKAFFFSPLPVFYLTTANGRMPPVTKEPLDGTLFVQGNDAWKSAYDGEMSIKVRGNSTANAPKKSWKLKLASKAALAGMPKSKHWVLLANYYDETHLRGKLGADFANAIGSMGMRSEWVECVLNGSWQGLYQLSEHIRIEKNRVNIFDWEDEAEARGIVGGDTNLSWVDSTVDDITGGYLFESSDEYDERAKFTVTAANLTLKTMVKSPEYLDTNPTMMAWCRTYLQEYADALTSFDGYSPAGRHYGELADVESMAAYFLVMELFGNDDAVRKSRYFYKDRGAPLKFGPVWDFDGGVGDSRYGYHPEIWCVNYGPVSIFREWADDPWFCTLLWTRYQSARGALVEICREGGLIDQYFTRLRRPAEANERLWFYRYGFSGGIYGTGDHPGLKAFFQARLKWLDRQFRDVPTLMASLREGTKSISTVFPLPYVDQSCPYVASPKVLPPAFANAPEGGVPKGRNLRLSFSVGGNVATVGVYVNGPKVGAPVKPDHGRIDRVIPSSALTAAVGEPNCISLVAFDTAGRPIARNYALVWSRPGEGGVIFLR